jgi:phage shock protein A
MLDTDIEGMDPAQAAEYVLAFVTTLKQTEKSLSEAVEETATWNRRVALARSRGEEGLAAQAQARASDALARQTGLEAELADLKAKVVVLKDKLARLKMTGGRLVNTDLLLAQLLMAAGEKDALGEAMKSQEADAALDELKKKNQS